MWIFPFLFPVPAYSSSSLALLIATLAASSVISMTGLISFISLLAPHGARLLFKNNRLSTTQLRT